MVSVLSFNALFSVLSGTKGGNNTCFPDSSRDNPTSCSHRRVL